MTLVGRPQTIAIGGCDYVAGIRSGSVDQEWSLGFGCFQQFDFHTSCFGRVNRTISGSLW